MRWISERGKTIVIIPPQPGRGRVRPVRVHAVPVAGTLTSHRVARQAAEPYLRAPQVGIVVRTLPATDLSPSRRHVHPDLVLFDGEVSYELTGAPRLDPATPRYFVNTRFAIQPQVASARVPLFEDPGRPRPQVSSTVTKAAR
jgi:hypothetical protein